jgi:hypothetical protein
MEDYKIYESPEDLIYVKKGDIKSFGKMVVLTNDSGLSIDDYELMNEEEHKNQIHKEMN